MRPRRLSSRSILAIQIALAVGFFTAWEGLTALGVLDPFFTSRPSSIASQLAEWVRTGYLWEHVGITFLETISAFLIAVVLGVTVGYSFGVSDTLARVFQPFMGIANAIPKVTLGPILILWFGVGLLPKIVLGVLIVFFIIFYNTFTGVRSVDRVLVDNVRVLGASRFEVARHVLIPSALSWIFSSLQTSVGFAVVGAVVAEYLAASRGIGYLIQNAEASFDSTGVMSGFVILALFVLGVQALIAPVEKYLLRWKPKATNVVSVTA